MFGFLRIRTIDQKAKVDIEETERRMYDCERQLEFLSAQIAFYRIRLKNLEAIRNGRYNSIPTRDATS